jgi:Ycf66 protein N-terminus
MLAYILAVLVGSGSVGLYIAAFFYPEIHRKQDFIWSGVGCFYALFLWVYAHQVTGGILVGQTTSVILLGWFAWQTFQLRRQLAPIDREAAIANAIQLPNRKGTTKSAPLKPAASTPVTTPSDPSIVPLAPVDRVKQSREKSTAPAAVQPTSIEKQTVPVTSKPAASEKPTTPVAAKTPNIQTVIPVASKPATNEQPTTPVATVRQSIDPPALDPIPLADVKIPPANIKATPPAIDRQVASPSQQPSPPPTTPSLEPEEDRAWIKLEVKPESARSKPLGTPAQPPTPLLSAATNPEEIARSTQSRPQTDPKRLIQSDSAPIAKVELEEPN